MRRFLQRKKRACGPRVPEWLPRPRQRLFALFPDRIRFFEFTDHALTALDSDRLTNKYRARKFHSQIIIEANKTIRKIPQPSGNHINFFRRTTELISIFSQHQTTVNELTVDRDNSILTFIQRQRFGIILKGEIDKFLTFVAADQQIGGSLLRHKRIIDVIEMGITEFVGIGKLIVLFT